MKRDLNGADNVLGALGFVGVQPRLKRILLRTKGMEMVLSW